MKLVPFIAENSAAALAQIHQQLGAEAVVVSVRKLPAQGFSKLWQRHGQIEVLAGVPDENVSAPKPVASADADIYIPFAETVTAPERNPAASPRRWASIAWLQTLGLLPEFAELIENKIFAVHGEIAPPNPVEEWRIVRDALAGFWRAPRRTAEGTGRPHVFIGPPGSGKTTALCKWMTGAVLTQNHGVKVWRLDGSTANTSEFLSMHCELLGLQAERFWSPAPSRADLLFVDLPGVAADDAPALEALREQLAGLPQPHLHLVLNAACETQILFKQIRAFETLAPEDLIFTHLDEVQHRVKLWNFVLGTNLPLGFLSAGQKIPGEFCRVDSTSLFPRENARK